MSDAPDVKVLDWRVGETERRLSSGAGTLGWLKSFAAGAILTALGALGHGLYQAATMAERLDRARADVAGLAVQLEALAGKTQEQRVRIEGLSQSLDYERKRAERLEGQLERLQERKR